MKLIKFLYLVIVLHLLIVFFSCTKEESREVVSQKGETADEIIPVSSDSVLFLSTQMNPIEEANVMRTIILKDFSGAVDFKPNDNNFIMELIPFEQKKAPERSIIFGGLHGDFHTLLERDMLDPLDDFYRDFEQKNFIPDFLEYGRLNSDSLYYIPWMQATYIMAVNRKALDYLPVGSDIFSLSYNELKEWAEKIYTETGELKLGFPAGEKGLMHRFFQGYLLPSYTGTSPLELNTENGSLMWEEFKEIWKFVNPKSLLYMTMSDPLLTDEVWIAWDHTARLVKAIKAKPDDFIAIPSPSGPAGRGYMTVLSGLGLPKDLKNKEESHALIKYLTSPEVQNITLEASGFFPVLLSVGEGELSPYMNNILNGVALQSSSSDSLPTLLPMGLRDRGEEFNSIYIQAFVEVVLENKPIQEVLDSMESSMITILESTGVQWW